jgi:hypothetical protein
MNAELFATNGRNVMVAPSISYAICQMQILVAEETELPTARVLRQAAEFDGNDVEGE